MVTPLRVERFAHYLEQHPNQEFVSYVMDGITNGFRVGFDPLSKLKSAKSNNRSATINGSVIDEYLANEVYLGRVAGPFEKPPIEELHISSFGVLPKRNQPNKWRLIVDLSSPDRFSVNDGIDPSKFTLQYVQLDQILKMVGKLGKGALMAKFDVQSAYRNVPVHPSDRYLLGLKWRDSYFVDLVLPFGLRSAPFIFDSVASAIEWILSFHFGLSAIEHYLDDFILAGPPQSRLCERQYITAQQVCQELGVPLHDDKCEGPSTKMVILGIEIDSVRQVACLPLNKLVPLQQLIHSWQKKRWCNRKQLESLIGHLHHAAKVVWSGRTFIRRMLDLLCCFRSPAHPIRLNQEFRLDLMWWHTFLGPWNGVSFWFFPGMSSEPSLEVCSDASGAIGYGAIFKGKWFNGFWDPLQFNQSIAYKELFPIVLAAHLWGSQWSGHHVCFKCDNEAVVHILNNRTSKIPLIMRLLRKLLLQAANFNFTFKSHHIPGYANSIADSLSRFHWQAFRQLAPQAEDQPTSIHPLLLKDLM